MAGVLINFRPTLKNVFLEIKRTRSHQLKAKFGEIFGSTIC